MARKKLPDNPTVLYAMPPPEEALPAFNHVLYFGKTKPTHGVQYVQMVTNLNQGRDHMDRNDKVL